MQDLMQIHDSYFFFSLPSVYVSKNCFVSSLNPVDIITYKCKHSCSFSACCQISSLCDILKCHRNAQTQTLLSGLLPSFLLKDPSSITTHHSPVSSILWQEDKLLADPLLTHKVMFKILNMNGAMFCYVHLFQSSRCNHASLSYQVKVYQ